MKAVVYHADASIAQGFEVGTYKKLMEGLKENCNKFGIPLIHLTIKGFEGWGNENYYFDGDPADIVYNREKFFIEFLKQADDEIYWFTEPDSRINVMFPPLEHDLALLIRAHAEKRITPAWRLAKPTALPFFEEALSYYDQAQKAWDGDTVGFRKMWEQIGMPTGEGVVSYNNISIELRNYKQYCMRKSIFTQQFKADHKNELLVKEEK
jgi:hypothetical protein